MASKPFKIYHNPRCSKSRETLKRLQDQGVVPEVILYLEHPPTADELRGLLKALGCSARGLLRTGEDAYAQLGLGNPDLDDDTLVAAMAAHPRLIERPIVVHGPQAVLGRPPENVDRLLEDR